VQRPHQFLESCKPLAADQLDEAATACLDQHADTSAEWKNSFTETFS
jgi:hypothetical protein